ncbi:MAG: hypothetical protein DBX59_03625 [Bacillota bacterium]|nr:MAG: hypothetical protein DBX59_03625 [Bacillota bacterium]
MKFIPDYRNLTDAAENRKPKRIPLYEHNIDCTIMERLTGKRFASCLTDAAPDYDAFFAEYNAFFKEYGYDTVTYEACITEILPFGGALGHMREGYIDCREKFESYPFDKVLPLYQEKFDKRFTALAANMPDGMLAVGGVGTGVFEITQDLVGYENLALMSFEDPELFADIFVKVGEVMFGVWEWFLKKHGNAYCVCRFGDDLGYKSNTLLSHADIKKHILPQYKRIVDLIHSYHKPFLLHSCGCIFGVMDDIIREVGIDAKHSNEDQIAEMDVWVQKYGDKIGNFGGIDTDHLVRMDNESLVKRVEKVYALAANKNGGFAIGSGNSIPAYVDSEKYLLMIDTVRKLRGDFD